MSTTGKDSKLDPQAPGARVVTNNAIGKKLFPAQLQSPGKFLFRRPIPAGRPKGK